MDRNMWKDVIPIYQSDGKQVNEIKLPEKILSIPTKRGGFSKSGLYYKGSGIVYQGHLVNQLSDTVKLLEPTQIIYEKYHVCYPELVGKYGIFLFPHQEIFSDCEGGCGKKEKKIIRNQKCFEKTAIEEIVNIIDTGIPEHSIYVYHLRDISGGINDTIELLEYVLTKNYNTAWDKNLWADIFAFGYVRDVADWYESDKTNHKLGTTYALLNSLYRADKYLYALLLLQALGTYSFEKNCILYYSALIVQKYCPTSIENEGLDLTMFNQEIFEKLIAILFSGNACCHLEDEKKWEWVREEFGKARRSY